MKKGFMGMQLNFIYVAIIGIVIFLIAFSAINKIKKSAELDLLSDVKIYLDNILKNIQLNNKGETEVELPNVEVQFDCDSFTVKATDESTLPLTDNIVFAPDTVKNKILGYSEYWYMPFDAEFFSFITSPGIKYAFFDSANAKKLYEAMPSNTNKVISMKPTDYEEERIYKIRYITFDYLPSVKQLGGFAEMEDKDVTLVKVEIIEDGVNFPDSFGKVTYYTKKDGAFIVDRSVFYFDKASLLGAVYSETGEKYECEMTKALGKLSIIATMKKQKMDSFSKNADLSNCPFERSLVVLNDLAMLTAKPKLVQQTMSEIYSQGKLIKAENILLGRLSCPMMY